MKSSVSNFTDFRQLSNDLRDKMRRLQTFGNELKMDALTKSLEEILEKTSSDCFKVAVVGEFKRGKSTLINALLGKAILPADVMPATAALNRVTYDINPGVRILYKDGKEESIDIDKLPDYVTKLTAESEEKAAQIKMATVLYPTNFCRNNVDILDTPGLNDDATMTEVTLSVLPEIDAALFVIMAQSPFSEYERDFLVNKILTSDLGRVLFVITGIDRLDEDEVDRLLEAIRTRIKVYVLEKAKKLMGENSPEYESYKQKIGEPKIFGISAKQALKAKSTGDAALLDRSRFVKFEQELERFLTEERGAITLAVQVNKLISASEEIVKTIHLQVKSLAMGCEEFSKKYADAKEKIAKIREKRQSELKKVEENAKRTFEALQPMALRFWEDVGREMQQTVEDFEITPEMLSKERLKETQEELLKRIKTAADNKSQLLIEQIQMHINTAAGEEAVRLEEFQNDFALSVESVRNAFTNNAINGDVSTKEQGIVTGLSFFVGGGALTGAYAGYKQGGWKGAALGGGIGFGTTLLALWAIPAALFSIPVMIGILALSGYTSSKILGVLFGKQKIASLKQGFSDEIRREMEKQSSENNIENKIKDQIDQVFGEIKKHIYSETENVLNNLESTFSDLNQRLVEHRVLADKEKEELQKKLAELDAITHFSLELNKSLFGMLAK